jgi:ABC-type sugar transport system ATPase subunit
MDEPLSNLDAILRLQTRTELKRLHHEFKSTFVFVTHDQEEAMTLGTRIIVLNQGKMVQFNTPQKIYSDPATRFVAEFIGRPAMNTIEGKISNGYFIAGELELPVAKQHEGKIVLGIRPEHIILQRQAQNGFIPFTLDVVELVQPDTLLFVKTGGNDPVTMVVRVMEDCSDLKPHDIVHLKFPDRFIHFFDISSGERLT